MGIVGKLFLGKLLPRKKIGVAGKIELRPEDGKVRAGEKITLPRLFFAWIIIRRRKIMSSTIFCNVQSCKHNTDRACVLRNVVVGNDTFAGVDAKEKCETECVSFEACEDEGC